MLGIKSTIQEGAINSDGETFVAGVWWKPWTPFPNKPKEIMPRPLWDIYRELYWHITTGVPVPPTAKQGIEGRKLYFMKMVDEIWGTKDSIYPFEWNPIAEKMLEKKLEYNFLMIAGHGGSGKSRFGALWAICNFLFDPFNTKVLVTSMTLKAAEGKIWGDISEAWQQACRRIASTYGCTDHAKAETFMPGKFLQVGIIKYFHKGVESKKAGLELIACDANSAKDSAEKVQGYHRGRVIAVLDELATLNHQLMTTIESNVFTNPHSDIIGLFNPDSHFDPAGRASAPIVGWNNITIEDDGWENANGWTMRLDGAKSPNVMLGYERYAGLLTKSSYEDAKNKKTDKEFNKQYRAWWSTAGTQDAIYSEQEIEQYFAHICIGGKEWIEPPTPVAFCDPSFAHGGDKAALQFGLCGNAMISGKMRRILSMKPDDLVNIDATIDPAKPKVEQLVEKVIEECQKRGVKPKHFGMDTSSGNVEVLVARDWMDGKEMMCVSFGEAPSEKPISKVDKTPANEKYSRVIDEIWYGAKFLIRSQQIRGLHPEVINQMTSRLFKLKNNKISVETKADMKKRALKSPNEADAALGLIFLCRHRLQLLAEEEVSRSPAKLKDQSLMKIAQAMQSMSTQGFEYTGGSSLWNG